jgi:hypothetical protein
MLTVGLGACSSSSSCAANTNVKVNGKQTVLTLNSSIANALSTAGITTSAGSPASQASGGGIQFPITGGNVNNSTLVGTINHSGSVKFSGPGGRSLTFSNPVINSAGVLSATYNGATVNLLQIGLSSASKSTSSKQVSASGVTATLAQAGALALNNGLVVSTFSPGAQIGTLSTTVTYSC